MFVDGKRSLQDGKDGGGGDDDAEEEEEEEEEREGVHPRYRCDHTGAAPAPPPPPPQPAPKGPRCERKFLKTAPPFFIS